MAIKDLQERWDSLSFQIKARIKWEAFHEAYKINEKIEEQKLVDFTQQRLLRGAISGADATHKDIQRFIILNPYAERPDIESDIEYYRTPGNMQYVLQARDSVRRRDARNMHAVGRVLGLELEAWEFDNQPNVYLFFKPSASEIQCTVRLDIMWEGFFDDGAANDFIIEREVSARYPDPEVIKIIDSTTNLEDPVQKVIGQKLVAAYVRYVPRPILTLLWDNDYFTTIDVYKEPGIHKLDVYAIKDLDDVLTGVRDISSMSVALFSGT